MGVDPKASGQAAGPGVPGTGAGSAVPTPIVNVTANVVGGAPPAELADQVPGLNVSDFAKLEKTVLDRLAGNPAEAARFLNDPIGVLRAAAPGSAKLIATLDAHRAAAAKTAPDMSGVDLQKLDVKVGKPQAPARSAAARARDAEAKAKPKPKPKPKRRKPK